MKTIDHVATRRAYECLPDFCDDGIHEAEPVAVGGWYIEGSESVLDEWRFYEGGMPIGIFLPDDDPSARMRIRRTSYWRMECGSTCAKKPDPVEAPVCEAGHVHGPWDIEADPEEASCGEPWKPRDSNERRDQESPHE